MTGDLDQTPPPAPSRHSELVVTDDQWQRISELVMADLRRQALEADDAQPA